MKRPITGNSPLVALAALLFLAAMPRAMVADPAVATRSISARDLIGAWHLLGIEVETKGLVHNDPFFNGVDSGLLIYDRAGWVSVQIVSTGRQKVNAPSTRPEPATDPGLALQKGALIDSYYAYFGRWSFNPQTSVVTHHVSSSLYPGEQGARYTQQVRLLGNRLILSRPIGLSNEGVVQRKIWERVSPASLAAG